MDVVVALRGATWMTQDDVTPEELALSEALFFPFSTAFDFSSSEAYKPCS